MGPIWGRQGPGGPRVGPMNFAIWVPWNSSLSEKMVAISQTIFSETIGKLPGSSDLIPENLSYKLEERRKGMDI